MNPERTQHLSDALRLFVLGEGAAMIMLHFWSLYELYRRTGPKAIVIGVALRWIGHVLVTFAISLVVINRIGDPLNIWSPLFLVGYTALAVAAWLTRKYDPVHELPKEGHP